MAPEFLRRCLKSHGKIKEASKPTNCNKSFQPWTPTFSAMFVAASACNSQLKISVRGSDPYVFTGCVSHHFIFMQNEVSILKHHRQGILGKFELLVLAKDVKDLNMFLNLTTCPGLVFYCCSLFVVGFFFVVFCLVFILCVVFFFFIYFLWQSTSIFEWIERKNKIVEKSEISLEIFC